MLRFIDSCQHYNTSQITKKWTALNDAGIGFDATIESTGGRNNGYCMKFACTNNTVPQNSYLQKTIDARQTWIIGFNYQTTSLNLSSTATDRRILQVIDGSTVHLTFILNTAGTIAVYRGDGTTLLGTTVNSINTEIFYYLEFKVTIDDSAGTVDIQCNGDSWLSLSSQDTRNGGNATANVFRFFGMAKNAVDLNILWSDWYFADTQAGSVTDFLGPRRCDAYFYTADGNYTQWAESTGTTHYELVDDNPANATDYITGEVGEKFTLKTISMNHTPTEINGITLQALMLKSDAGAINVQRLARQSGYSPIDVNSANLTSPGSASYTWIANLMETNPVTGVAFTQSDIETDLELGFEVTA